MTLWLAAFLMILPVAARATVQTYTVLGTNETQLSAAITQANLNPGSTILIKTTGTLGVRSDLPAITADMNIIG
ncbi:MAG: hypothetical protein WCH43_09495, partial [Verrucomicrobiota bacterium]